jgi:predicted dehydrogenase
MGTWHARALSRAGARVAAVVDRDVSRARRLAGEYRCCAVAASIQELVPGSIDVFHICTPTATHAEFIELALRADCHVLVEKPLAADEATTHLLLELAAARGRLLCPVHQVLFQRGTRRILTLLDQLRPVHIELMMCSAGASQDSDDDFVGEALSHPLSFLAATLSKAHLNGRWTVSRAGAGELRATLAGPDAIASVLVSTHGRPTIHAARLIGPTGTAHLDFFHGFAVVQSPAVSRGRKVVQPLLFSTQLGAVAAANLFRRAMTRQAAYPGLWELIAAFYRQLRSGGGSPISPAHTMRVAAMRDLLMAQS